MIHNTFLDDPTVINTMTITYHGALSL